MDTQVLVLVSQLRSTHCVSILLQCVLLVHSTHHHAVHTSSGAVQVLDVPETHDQLVQLSAPLQATQSLHEVPLFAWLSTHTPLSQVSGSVQELLAVLPQESSCVSLLQEVFPG